MQIHLITNNNFKLFTEDNKVHVIDIRLYNCR